MPLPDISVVPVAGAVREVVEANVHHPGVLAQHHPIWLDVLQDLGEEAVGVAALRGDQLAGWMLASLRSGSLGTVVTSLPWVVYGGPALPSPDREAAVALLDWFRTFAQARGASAVSVALSPFALDDHVRLVTRALEVDGADLTFRYDNFAQVQSLRTHPLQQVGKSRRDSLASLIRRAQRGGVEVGPCGDTAIFTAWLDVYRKRYEEIGARPLSDAFHQAAFERGRAAGVVEFWIARRGDELLGGSLFLVGADVVDYFSSAYVTTDQVRTLAPNTLLLAAAFTAFAERGRQWFNWQSSPGRGGVYRFKAGWGAEERPQLYLGRLGADAERLRASSPAIIAEQFPARFVLPYSMLRGAEVSVGG